MSLRTVKEYIQRSHPHDPILRSRFNKMVLKGGKTPRTDAETWRFLFTGETEEAPVTCNPQIIRFMSETLLPPPP